MSSSPPRARGVVRFLGSLTFLIILLGAMLVALILPTIVNQLIDPDYGYDRTVGALRRDWYGAWWFNILMGLLMVNLTVCTVIRTPWRFFWMWGFLITHSGILTLMIGAAVTFNTKIYGDLQAVEGASYDYFTIENENEIEVTTSDGERSSFPIRANPYIPSTNRKTFKMPASSTYIHVEEFVPNVRTEPAYRESAGRGETLVEIAAHAGESEPQKTALKPQQPIHYGPMAFEARTISREGFAHLSEPPPERNLLVVTLGGETREIDIAAEKDKPVRVGDADVTVKQWKEPDDRISDYAVLFEITRAGRPTESWGAFALGLDQSPIRFAEGSAPADFQARVRTRMTPAALYGRGTKGALILFKTPGGLKYLFLSEAGERASGVLQPGARLSNPFMPRAVLETEFIRWLDNAEEIVEPADIRRNVPRNPALRVVVDSGGHKETRWVKFFSDGTDFEIDGRIVRVVFQGRRYSELPFTLTLNDFRVEFNQGTRSPKHFESTITLRDHETGEVTKKTIEVNTPMKYKGFVIYQASWNERNRQMSIFQISKDPGKKILYLGWVMAVSGAIFMFFLKPFLQRLIKTGSKGEDAPLGSGAALGLFALMTLGTVGGMVAPLLLPGVDPLWLGLAVAGADLVLALVIALVARAWKAFKPVRALQAGEILAAGWCLNTAALVILLMMKVTA